MTETTRVCIDSSVFLAFLKDERERGSIVRAVLGDAKAGTIKAAVGADSVFTFDDRFLKRYDGNPEGLSVCHPFVDNPRLF